MAIPSQRKWDEIHQKNIDKYARQIRQAYRKLIKEVSELAYPLQLNVNDEFYWRNYPEVNKKVNDLLKNMYSEVYSITVTGINTEWDLAVEKNNEIARYVFGKDLDKLPKKYKELYLSNNGQARRNFLYRKEKGLGLSEKVWNNTRQFKTELELALENGIGTGKSADSIAREITDYLNEPDKLFRRIREKENGPLRLSKAAKVYNPGRGRYRSSYKNAFRLTRNETNFSYEGAQYEKRLQQDFIVGVRIQTSPGHNPADDKGGISCIDLAGDYPKEYNWTYKWHVNCICYSTNILKTREEMDADTDSILNGGEPSSNSINSINQVSRKYNNYIANNKNKWENWKNKPRTFVINSD